MKPLHRYDNYFFLVILIIIVAVIWGQALHTPPKIKSLPNRTIKVGQTYSAIGSFTDPDSTSWKAYVHYGLSDNNFQVLELKLNPNKTFYLHHQFIYPGNYTLLVIIIDNQGTIGSATTKVIVKK